MDVDQTRSKIEKIKEDRSQQKREHKEREKKLSEQALKMVKKRHGKAFWTVWGDYIGYAAMAVFIAGLIYLNYSGDNRKLDQILVNDDAFIRAHNEGKGSMHTTAASEYFQGINLQEARKRFSGDLSKRKIFTKCNAGPRQAAAPASNYNFYEAYPQCRSELGEQTSSSSYVSVPLSVYKDRTCSWGQTERIEPSTAFFLQCNTKINKGEKGGYLLSTLHFMKQGFVSQECWQTTTAAFTTTSCPTEALKVCKTERIAGYCHLQGEDAVKAEIAENGPVISLMRPYRDFLVYSTGVYNSHDASKLDGVIFVKIVGWGQTSEGVKYWLVDPLWGKTWGTDGIAQVKIGFEDSLIEQYAFTLYPEDPALLEIPAGADSRMPERVKLYPTSYIETE